jgi:hypothetical protein
MINTSQLEIENIQLIHQLNPNLQSVSFDYASKYNTDQMIEIISNCHNLQTFTIKENCFEFNHTLRALHRPNNIKILHLWCSESVFGNDCLSTNVLLKVLHHNPQLEMLYFSKSNVNLRKLNKFIYENKMNLKYEVVDDVSFNVCC